MVRNALIIGATGLTGSELISQLIKSDYYNSLHILVRKKYELEHQKIKSYMINFDEIASFKADAVIHDVFICLGTTMKKAGSKEGFRKVDFEYVSETGKWAKQNQVEKIALISSMGASSTSSNFYLKTKGDAEEALAALHISALLILRPSLLLGKRKEFRLGEKIGTIIMKPLQKLMIAGLRKYKPVEAAQVAHAMFKGLINADVGVNIMENEVILEY